MNQSIKKDYFDKALLEIIVCPITKEPLVWDKSRHELISKKANLAYPIVEGIPILLEEKARKIK